MTNTQQRSVTQVGWDGISQPIYRYTDEMHLSDHLRSIVSTEDRPDRHKGHPIPVITPELQAHADAFKRAIEVRQQERRHAEANARLREEMWSNWDYDDETRPPEDWVCHHYQRKDFTSEDAVFEHLGHCYGPDYWTL